MRHPTEVYLCQGEKHRALVVYSGIRPGKALSNFDVKAKRNLNGGEIWQLLTDPGRPVCLKSQWKKSKQVSKNARGLLSVKRLCAQTLLWSKGEKESDLSSIDTSLGFETALLRLADWGCAFFVCKLRKCSLGSYPCNLSRMGFAGQNWNSVCHRAAFVTNVLSGLYHGFDHTCCNGFPLDATPYNTAPYRARAFQTFHTFIHTLVTWHSIASSYSISHCTGTSDCIAKHCTTTTLLFMALYDITAHCIILQHSVTPRQFTCHHFRVQCITWHCTTLFASKTLH